MTDVSILHLVGQSSDSWEDAVRQALREATQKVDNIQTIYVKEMLAEVENNEITNFNVHAKITFLA